jgi:tetratricopeptide (TPR) repeat protein
VLRGIAHTRLDEFSAAEADFQKALQSRGDDADLRYAVLVNWGVLRTRQGRLEEALADVQRVMAGGHIPLAALSPVSSSRRFEDAVTELRAARNLKPDRPQAYRNLARAYQYQRKLDAAVAELGHALEVARKLDPPARADLYRDRARLHLQRQDLLAALGDLDRAVALAPSAADHAERGRILHVQGKPREAVTAYDRALEIEPGFVEVCRWRAEGLVALAKYQEAAVWFDQFLQRGGKPGADFYQARGQTRARLGKYPAAIEDFNQALALRRDSSTHSQRGWLYLLERGAPLVALDDFQAAIRLNDKNADAYLGRGSARVALGRHSAAVGDAEQGLRLGPRDQLLLYKAARIYAQAVGRLDDEERWQKRSAPLVRSEYQDRALGLLRQALDSTPTRERAIFWRDFIRQADHAFDPIRQSPGFVRLAADYSR